MMADPDSIHAIYVSLRARLARAVMRIVPPKEVEDIVQETYVRVCQADYNDRIRAPRSFMFRTARNLALDYVKSSEFRLSVSAHDAPAGEGLGVDRSSDDTFASVSSKEEFARFSEAVRHLPTQCRRAFVLRKVYGYSQREIAAEMKLSENTVEKHIATGIRKCGEFMRRFNGPDDACRSTNGGKGKRRVGIGKRRPL
jgi:RNA polymerase sigma-70 factor (ECF subfamily)